MESDISFVSIYYTKSKTFKGLWRTINMEKSIIKNDVDIFHGLSNEIPRIKNKKIPFVVTIHDLIFKRFPRNYRSIDRKIYNIKYKYQADYDYFYRMIVLKKMDGVATKKREIVGIFRRGGFSSKISYRKLFFEELKIRYNNKQNVLIITIIAVFKFFKHFRKIIK